MDKICAIDNQQNIVFTYLNCCFCGIHTSCTHNIFEKSINVVNN